jgi:hypothetical protein
MACPVSRNAPIHLLAGAAARIAVSQPPGNRHASSELRLLRTPARSFQQTPGLKPKPNTTAWDSFDMIANALLLTIAILLAYGFWLLDQLKFMARYRAVLFQSYGGVLFLAVAVLFVNVFGAALLLQRKFFLKDTGRKLSHLDRQFQLRHIEMPVPEPDQETGNVA